MSYRSLETRNRKRIAAFSHSSKLSEKADVVLIKLSNIINIVPPQADALHAKTEGEAGHFFRIVTDRGEHVRIDHAGAPHFDPAVVPLHIDFHAGLREWEERRAEADVHLSAEVAHGKQPQH